MEITVPKPHSENAFAPMCSPKKNGAWFAVSCVRHSKRDARAAFVEASATDWRDLLKAGWRIVRVKVVQS